MSADRVEQIVFGWNARNVAFNDGYGPVAFSCDEDDARQVFGETRWILRPRGVQNRLSLGRRPLSDGRVMVFRRTPTTDSAGPPGTLCHALVGDAKLLNVPNSLGLHYWDWPLDEEPVIGRGLPPLDDGALDLEQIEYRREVVNAQFDEQSLAGPLRTLIAHWLLRPDARLLIMDDSGGFAPVPLLYKTGRLLGGSFLEAFSTFESDDTEEWQTAFVTEWPTGALSDTARVDLRERVGGDVEDIAGRLLTLRDQDETATRNLVAEAVKTADAKARLSLLAHELSRVDPVPLVRKSPAPVADKPAPARRPRPKPVPHNAHTYSYSYGGQFSKPSGVFIGWRLLVRTSRWFRGSEYLPAQSPSMAAQTRQPDTPLGKRIRRLDDDRLISLATGGGPQAGDALQELWRKRAYRSRRDNEYLCGTVLSEWLYVGLVDDPDSAQGASGVELATALFDIFVRPRPRGQGHDAELHRVLLRLWDFHEAPGRALVTRIVTSRGNQAPEARLGLPEHTWRGLFERALEEQPPPPKRPAAQVPPKPSPRDDFRGPDRRPALAPQASTYAGGARATNNTMWRLAAAICLVWLLAILIYLVVV
jgi:hypothetical protein